MRPRGRSAIQILILVAGVGMIAVGVLSGDPVAVMRKAIYICLECIGIG